MKKCKCGNDAIETGAPFTVLQFTIPFTKIEIIVWNWGIKDYSDYCAEDYIKEKWGDEWLTHNWEAGDVIDALEEFASLKSQLSEAGEEKKSYDIEKSCFSCKFFEILCTDEPCESCYPIAYSNWQPR